MEIKNKYVCRGVFLPTGNVYWASANGGWTQDINSCRIFSSSGAGNRVNSMNKNDNWVAEKLPVAIKVMEI